MQQTLITSYFGAPQKSGGQGGGAGGGKKGGDEEERKDGGGSEKKAKDPNTIEVGGYRYVWTHLYVRVFQGDAEVAYLDLDEVGDAAVVSMVSVNAAHRRRGIATRMVQFAMGRLQALGTGLTLQFPTSSDLSDDYYLVDDGAALLNMLLGRNILTGDNLFHNADEY